VKNGGAQIVDARPASDYGTGSIPGAMNIPFDAILDNEKIKNESAIKKIFSGLGRDKPVVVFTNTGMKASLVWYALTLMGYDARLYSWQNWLESQPTLNLGIKEVRAEPNPAVSGAPIKIVAVFGEGGLNASSVRPTNATPVNNSTSSKLPATHKEIRLTIKKGCATCEPITIYTGGSLTSTKEGGVKLGSIGKIVAQAFKSDAVIRNSEGSKVARVSMQPVSGDEYAGIWNASVSPGIYKANIIASVSGASKTFKDVLEIAITSSK
jgi:thiosulfate/3-mercaptopyruvate sulfurtransferase